MEKSKRIVAGFYALVLCVCLVFAGTQTKGTNETISNSQFWAGAAVLANETGSKTASNVITGVAAVHTLTWIGIASVVTLGTAGTVIAVGYVV